MKNIHSFFIVITVLVLASLACGSVEVGIVPPTTKENPINAVDIQEPTSLGRASGPN